MPPHLMDGQKRLPVPSHSTYIYRYGSDKRLTDRKLGRDARSASPQKVSGIRHPYMHDRFDDEAVELQSETEIQADRISKNLERGAHHPGLFFLSGYEEVVLKTMD